MNIRDRKGLKQMAAARLSEASFDPRLLALLYIGVSVGVSLVLSLISYILQQQIGGTGGLSGIGLRSVLVTGQAVLQLASMLLLPFWEIGMVYTAIQLARGQDARPASLAEGFRRFGPVLRLTLLRTAVFFAIAILCMNLSAGIFMMTPLSDPMYDLLLPIAEAAAASNTTPQIDDTTMLALMETVKPMIPIFLVLFLVLAVPILYRLRMADYLLMEEKKTGALEAMLTSWRMTRRRVGSLLLLDLSFWWFYALQALATMLTYSDLILPALGISLPLPADATYFLFYGLYTAATVALYWRFASYLQTTYAVAYDALRYHAAMPTPKPEPKEVPWDYEAD